MADHERNFRSLYYEKVSFRAVEEKKSVENLLRTQPIPKERLRQFCFRHGVPAMYRLYVWKVLLGILPINQCVQEFVWLQRHEQVKELEHTIKVLYSDDALRWPNERRVLIMKLINEAKLPLRSRYIDADVKNKYFMSIAQAVGGLVSCDVDLFWISTRFYHYLSENVFEVCEDYPEFVMLALEKEDQGGRLYQHLVRHKLMSVLPLMEWYHTCFALVLPENAVERVWDRVLGGCTNLLVYITVAILQVLRRPLLVMHHSKPMVNYLRQIPDDCGDRIVNLALDLLNKNGGQLPPRPESPESGRSSAKSLTDSGGSSGPPKAAITKTRHGSIDGSVTSDTDQRSLFDSKSVTIEIGRRSPGSNSEKNGCNGNDRTG